MTVVTSTQPNRALPREELRRRIGDTALRLFREHGFDEVSVDQIVLAAGVSKGVFFNYFPTKADALIGYFHELDDRIAHLREELNPRRPLGALKNFFSRAEALLRAEGPLLNSLWQAILSHPTLMKADRASEARDRQGFQDFFLRAKALGTVAGRIDPVIAAEVIADFWTASVTRWLAVGQSHSFAEAVAPKLELVFRGLRGGRKS